MIVRALAAPSPALSAPSLAQATTGDRGLPGAPSGDLPGVAGQLVRVLSAPRPLAGGTYTVTVSLHPEALGAVQATVTAGDARLSVQLVASTAEGADALRQSLPDLHEALSAQGQPASVTVSSGGAQGTGAGARSGGAHSGPAPDAGNGGGHAPGGTTSVRISANGTGVRATTAGPAAPARPGSPGEGRDGGRLVDVHV